MAALPKPQQFSLFPSGLSEAELYHDPARPGFFSLLYDDSKSGRMQRSYKLAEMHRIIPLLDQKRNTWISQAEFIKPNRRVVNLWRVGLLFVDIDTYNIPQLCNKRPEHLVQVLLAFCADVGIPPPSCDR